MIEHGGEETDATYAANSVTSELHGADGIRTHDPLVANQVLSQLSYRPPAPPAPPRNENRYTTGGLVDYRQSPA